MKSINLTQISSFLFILVVISSCKTTKPVSDNTPPTITQWTLTDQSTQEIQKFSSSGGTATVTVGKEYVLTCYAKDPEGLSSLSLYAMGNYDCSWNENGTVYTKKNVYMTWYPFEGTKSKPDQDNKVPTILIYGKKFVILAKYPCDMKFIPFTGRATNYGNQSTEGDIKLLIK